MICRYCRQNAPDAPYCCFCGRPQEIRRSQRKRGNGQGSARKRGKTWTGIRPGYQFTDEEGLHRVRPTKGGFETKKEALEWASSSTAEMDGSPKLIDLWTQYKENDLPKLSANRQTAYKIARKKLEPLMGRQIHTLRLDELQDTINAACPTFYTARDCKTVLKALYKKAMSDNGSLVVKNVADFIVLPKSEETEATPFTEDELKKMWTAFDKGDYFIGYILLMCYTGMMPVELLQCRKEFVDTEKCEISKCGAKTKKRKTAVIVYPEILRPVVESLMKSKGDKLLAINKDNFYIEFYDCLARCGIEKKVPYSCRHTYGTEAVKLGVHPAIVQKMLRHSTQKTQERYTHLADEEVHEAAKLFSRGVQMVVKEG